MPNRYKSYFIADLGNSYLKSKIVGKTKEVYAIPHAIEFKDGGSWQREAEAVKRGSRNADRKNTKVFEMNGRGAIVGKRAFRANYTAPKVGEGKYSKEYFRYLMASQLIHHYPDGHDNISAHVAHPPNAIPYLSDLMRSIGGSYNIKLADGTRVKYFVREVACFDEPSGSMYTLLSENSDYQGLNLESGDTIFICDFGGRVSSMTTVEVVKDGHHFKLIPYFDDPSLSITFEGGAQTIMLALANELRAFNSDHIKGIATNLDRNFHLLESVFRTNGKLRIRGYEYDIREAFVHSISPFLDTVQANYEARGITSKLVALTGGTTSNLHDYLVNQDDKIIDHANIRPVCELPNLRFANILGAEIAVMRKIGRDG